MKVGDEKCCKCGKEATVAFGGGPNEVPQKWYCRECLFETFPQYAPMFLNAEKLAEQMHQETLEREGKETRILH